MSKGAKVLVTIGILIGFIFLFGLLTASRKSGGSATPGIFGLILFFGMIAGIRAVWRKPTEDKDNDNHHLDKTYRTTKTSGITSFKRREINKLEKQIFEIDKKNNELKNYLDKGIIDRNDFNKKWSEFNKKKEELTIDIFIEQEDKLQSIKDAYNKNFISREKYDLKVNELRDEIRKKIDLKETLDDYKTKEEKLIEVRLKEEKMKEERMKKEKMREEMLKKERLSQSVDIKNIVRSQFEKAGLKTK